MREVSGQGRGSTEKHLVVTDVGGVTPVLPAHTTTGLPTVHPVVTYGRVGKGVTTRGAPGRTVDPGVPVGVCERSTVDTEVGTVKQDRDEGP